MGRVVGVFRVYTERADAPITSVGFYMTKDAESYIRWKKTYTRRAWESYAPYVALFDSIGPPDMDTLIRYSEVVREHYGERSVTFAMSVAKNYVGYLERRHLSEILKDDVRVPRPYHRLMPHLTTPEYVSMLSFIRATTVEGVRDNCLIRMLYDTGARIGEVSELERGDIDLSSRTAEIRTEKTSNRRVVVWGKDTNRFLKEYLDIQPSGLFPGKRQCERIVRKYAELAGIEKHITCHSFRHTRAHVILDNGGTVKDVQETLGHMDPRSSFAYLTLSRTEAIERSRKFLDL